MKKWLTLVAFLWFCGFHVPAQSLQDALKPVTRTYALKQVTIITQPGQVIEGGTVVIKDGLIQRIGKEVAIPPGAKVLDADSMFVYAGFIDGLSQVGVPRPNNANDRSNRPRVPGEPTYEQAGITPQQDVVAALDVKEKSIEEMRKIGFTAAHVVPRGRMLPGKGAVILLHGEDLEQMVLVREAAMLAQLEPAGDAYPSTLIGVLSKFRELYRQSEQLWQHQTAYAASARGMSRPAKDEVLEAFFPVIRGEQPVFFPAQDVKSLHRVFSLQQELGFPLVLADVQQGWHLSDRLAQSKTPLFLSLDLPKKVKEEEAKEGEEEKAKDPEMEALRKRQVETVRLHEGQAGKLEAAGVTFGFSTMSAKANEIRENLNRMIGSGLSEDRALAALTTIPADLLGLSAMLGTVEEGKIANLVVSDKPYFAEGANVRFVIVDGTVFEYEAKKAKPAGDPAAKVQVGGKWSYTIDAPGQSGGGYLTLIDNGGEISGTLSGSQMPGEIAIQGASLSGNELSFTAPIEMQGQSLTLQFTLLIDGKSFEGTVSVGAFGSFGVEGDLVDDPK